MESTVSTIVRSFPLSPLAGLEMGGVSVPGMESAVGHFQHLVFQPPRQMLEMGVTDVGGGAIPSTDQAQMIERQAQLSPHDPTVCASSKPMA